MKEEEKDLREARQDAAKESAQPETADTAGDAEEISEAKETADAGDGFGGAQEPEASETKEADSAEASADEAEEGSDEAPEENSHKKQDPKDQKIEELNDRYRRLFADFDNFRKRTELEKAGMFTEGEKTVLLKVLPLIDNFERALSSISEEEKETPFADGIAKVYRSFTDQLKELGVTPIEAVGQPFDANLHNAVMHIEDENAGENEVTEEFQKGYLFKDKVLRYSMVKVAN